MAKPRTFFAQSAGDDKQTANRAKSEIVRIYEMQGIISELNL